MTTMTNSKRDVANKIIAKRVPFATIYSNEEHAAAATAVLLGEDKEIIEIFMKEILVHEHCDNWTKADVLREMLNSMV